MKSDVAAVQLSQERKVSYVEAALIGVILVIATKFCTLPSVLTGIAESKAVWVIALLTISEFVTAFFAIKAAKAGGLPALTMPRGAKFCLYIFYAAFFTLKLSAFTREVSTYYALSLFENVPVLPLSVLTIIACGILSRKGYMALGRMLEILMWLFVFVFLFIVIFTRTEGDAFNALAMVSPDAEGLGEGVAKGAAWFGDSALLAFLDLSGDTLSSPHAKGALTPPERSKAKRRIAFAAALFSALTLLLFYAVFIGVYGNAAKMTDYAFIKLSAFRANTDELGSADWPVIILWSVVTTVYLTLTFITGRECLYGIMDKEESPKKSILPLFLLGGAAVAFSLFFLQEEGDHEAFMTRVANVISFIAMGITVGLGAYVLIKKEKRDEK